MFNAVTWSSKRVDAMVHNGFSLVKKQEVENKSKFFVACLTYLNDYLLFQYFYFFV